MWLVTDCIFNRAWCPHLIGLRFRTAPSYCIVRFVP
jgi:hypothetical protein